MSGSAWGKRKGPSCEKKEKTCQSFKNHEARYFNSFLFNSFSLYIVSVIGILYLIIR